MRFKIIFFLICLNYSLIADEPSSPKRPAISHKHKEESKHADDKSKKPKKPKNLPENAPPPSESLSKPKSLE